MRPFAHIMTADEDTNYRIKLISNANFCIFLYGQHMNNNTSENSRGAIEEFEIANKIGKIIIPIGATGYASKQILSHVKRQLINYPYLERYIQILENSHNKNTLVKTVITILNEVNSSR